jgi:hypothetical protein
MQTEPLPPIDAQKHWHGGGAENNPGWAKFRAAAHNWAHRLGKGLGNKT